jgi:hypothetical protein
MLEEVASGMNEKHNIFVKRLTENELLSGSIFLDVPPPFFPLRAQTRRCKVIAVGVERTTVKYN